jgi:surface antigen
MRRISILTTAMALACVACQPLPDTTFGAPTAGQPPPMPTAGTQTPSAQPACSSYTVPVTVGGQPQQAVIEACQQADGSWRITQTTPGLPPQVYEVPAPANSPYPSAYSYPEAYPYPDFSPYWGWNDWSWGGSPWFLGLAPSIVVVQRFHHFHHGFAHGGHGFGRGFAPGAGHGFAGMRGSGMAGGHR